MVQIYNTMQESIDATITTPPSAILRQGSDVATNNPGLDIPGTPNNLIYNNGKTRNRNQSSLN